MQLIPIVACFVEFLPLLSSSAGEIHVQIGFKSGDWLGHLRLSISLPLSIPWLNWQGVLMQYEALPSESGGIFLNISRQDGSVPFQLPFHSKVTHQSLLSSYIKSLVKLRGPVPEAAMHAHAMTPPPPCFTDEAVCLGSFAVPFFLHIHPNCLLFSQSQLPRLHPGLCVSSSNARFRIQK